MTFYLPKRTADDSASEFALAATAPDQLDMGADVAAPEPRPVVADRPADAQPDPQPDTPPETFYSGRPSFGERFTAQLEGTRIQRDLNGRNVRNERKYLDSLIETIPPEFIIDARGDPRTTPAEQRHDWILAAARRAKEADPEQYGNLPTTIEEFDARLMTRRAAELDDAQAVLEAAPNGFFPELLGDAWAEITTPEGAMLMMIGAPAMARLPLTMALEGAAAAMGEVSTLSNQFDVAEDLDLPTPQPVRQTATAFAVGAGLGGGMYVIARGAERALGYRTSGDEAETARRPDDTTALQHRRQLDQAQDDLAAGRPASEPDTAPFDWANHRVDGGLRDDAISGMTPPLRSGLENMIQSAPPRIREGLQVFSGYRSEAVQARLWQDALQKYGSVAEARKWVAPPGNSQHGSGNAADLKWNGLRIDQAPSDVRQWLHRNARQFGLHFPLGNEPWHVEPLGTRGTAPARPRDSKDGQPLRFEDFDFSPKGNASPTVNPVGYVYGKLLSKGYTPEQAAGLVGNLIQESGPRLNTGAVGDGGNSVGMGQWNGPRMRALQAFARAEGRDWQDLDLQIDFLDHELRTTEKAAGDAIRATTSASEAARIASEQFWRPGIPRVGQRIGYAEDLAEFFAAGKVPYYPGSRAVGEGGPGSQSGFSGYSGTSRGFTSTGQVTAGDGFTIDVEYQVVDLATLRRASGDLQPRDRSRAASDEQISEIAARLDPARLMPAPEADRGAPIVGPDGVIESGNGRVMGIQRAYDRHQDRADAYRRQIELAGFDLPEGVSQPVLVARRTSELSDADRQGFVRAANTSTIARMSATERAAMDARGLDTATVGRFNPAFGLNAPENAAFTRAALDAMPQTERAGLVDATGKINAEGQLRIRQALFARAYDAPDLLARYTETDAGDLKSLLNALEQAAPEWAAMRAAVADGRLRPEMDITPFVLDAMRLIAAARETAAREGGKVAQVLDDLLTSVDLLEGAVPPLTVALVRKFMPAGRAAGADKIADFLKRYATEAQKIGGSDATLFDAPGPLDALKAIDPKGFGDLTHTGAMRATDPEPQTDPLPAAPRDAANEAARLDAGDDEAEAMLRAANDDSQPAGLSEQDMAELRAAADLEVTLEDGTTARVEDFLDDLDADDALATVVDLCGLGGGA